MSKETLPEVILSRLEDFMLYSRESHDHHAKALDDVVEQLQILNEKVITNTEYRLKQTAKRDLLKWLVGVFGIGNIIIIIQFLIN